MKNPRTKMIREKGAKTIRVLICVLIFVKQHAFNLQAKYIKDLTEKVMQGNMKALDPKDMLLDEQVINRVGIL